MCVRFSKSKKRLKGRSGDAGKSRLAADSVYFLLSWLDPFVKVKATETNFCRPVALAETESGEQAGQEELSQSADRVGLRV